MLLLGESTQWYREWDRDVNQGGYGHAPPGTYLVYVIYRSPLGYFIPLPARVEVKAVQRSAENGACPEDNRSGTPRPDCCQAREHVDPIETKIP